MILFFLFYFAILVQNQISCLTSDVYLVANYKLAGDFKDFTDKNGDATNNGTTWTSD